MFSVVRLVEVVSMVTEGDDELDEVRMVVAGEVDESEDEGIEEEAVGPTINSINNCVIIIGQYYLLQCCC